MGAPGPPGGFDLHKYFRAPTQSPYPQQSGGYQPTSSGSHQPSHSSYPPGSNAPSFQSSSNTYSNLAGSNYAFNTAPPQQSGSPVYHGQQFGMHFNQQPGPFSSSPFGQQVSSQFAQTPSSPSHTQSSQSSKLFSPAALTSLPQSLPSSPANSSHPLDGARLMALLTTQQSGSQDDKDSAPIPGAPHSSPRLLPSAAQEASGPPPTSAPATIPISSSRFQASKPPKGRYLRGDHIVYDIDVRKPGETQPQLEVSPITVYGSDPTLGLGRQIAVNRKFICYGLRGGTIRILNINSAQKSLLRGHSQRVSDMAFFSENAHLLASASEDGKIFVRRIHEGSGEDGKLTESILLAIQLVGDWGTCHPRLRWHPNSQDIIFIAIGRYVVAIDLSKTEQPAGAGGLNSDSQPSVCRLGSPVKGVSVAAEHDDVITDLDVPLSGPLRLASASKDGTVRIWGEQKQCLSVFQPHDGNPVDAVSYISATPQHSADVQFLLTGGLWNQNLKLWALEGPLSKSGQGLWKCTQTLEFQSSSTNKSERAFFNQVIGAPRAGLILVANAEKHAIYAIHIDFTSAHPRMDYLAEFSVAIPILSFTVAEDAVNESGEGTLKVFCVQTQAIQQHALDLSLCTPPPGEESEGGSTPSTPKKAGAPTQWSVPTSIAFTAIDRSHQSVTTSTIAGVSSVSTNPGIPPRPTSFASFLDVGSRYPTTAEVNRVADATKSTTTATSRDSQEGKGIAFNARVTEAGSNLAKPPTPPPRRSSRSRSPARAADMAFVPMYPVFPKHKAEKADAVKDIWLDAEVAEAPLVPAPPTTPAERDEQPDKEERDQSSSGVKPNTFRNLHLISPSDIMTLATKGDVAPDVSLNLIDVEDWQEETRSKHGSGTGDELADSMLRDESDDYEPTIGSLLGAFEGDQERGTQFIEKDMILESDDPTSTSGLELPGLMAMAGIDDSQNEYSFLEDKPPSDAESQDELKEKVAAKRSEGASSLHFRIPNPSKGRKSKNKNNGAASASQPQVSASSAPSTLLRGATDSSVDAGLRAQVTSMQETLTQLVSMQREMQKQMPMWVAAPVSKETKGLEGSFGLRMEKVVKANVDIMCARIAEESVKREKQDRERALQVSTLLNNFVSKDLPVALERGLKKEISAFGPVVAQSLLQPLQKSVSTGVTETFQKVAIEKFLPQLEKTTVAKLEAAITRQLKTQFQTSGRQTLQDALRAGLESLVIPAFERSCRAISEQLEAAFQAGMAEHTSNAQQQLASSNTVLGTTLQEVISSASGLLKVLNEDLQDCSGKLIELVETAGANFLQYGDYNQTTGNLPAQVLSVEHVEETLDPTIELNRLIKEGNFEEAFNKAFSLGDPQIVSWLCLQLDPSVLLATSPLPVSQGILLPLVRHLSFDLQNDTGHKLLWIKEAALALNPHDPRLVPHVRAYLEVTYQNCHKFMGETKVHAEQSMLRLVIHLINSLLSSCN